MLLTSYASGPAFLEVAGQFLLADEAVYNLQLSLADRVASGEVTDYYLPTVHEPNGPLVGAVVYTPPRKMVLTRMPQAAIHAVTRHARERWPNLWGVQGPVAELRAFARHWPRPGREGMR